MESLLGASGAVFIGVTLVLFGGASWLMGQAVAGTWRPVWQTFVYGALLATVDRFFIYALFEGELLAPLPYLVHAAVLIAIALLAFRLTRVRRMVSQYPWLYERAGPLSWRPVRWPEPNPRPEHGAGERPSQEQLPP